VSFTSSSLVSGYDGFEQWFSLKGKAVKQNPVFFQPPFPQLFDTEEALRISPVGESVFRSMV